MITRRAVLALGLAACVRPRGKPRDTLKEILDRVDAGRGLNAFITFDRARVLADAATARPGPLHALPIAVKDVIDTAGVRTTYATAALKDHVPDHDATIVARLKDAGAILLGKTNCDELSFGNASQDSAFGGVKNPYGHDRIPGGSSGGSAAAVGGGLCPVAIGADTTGSIRMPAALCGAIGFRPTTGRYPTTGVWPISPTLDTVGPIAAALDDIIRLDAVLADDPTPLPNVRARGLRIGVPRAHYYEAIDDQGVLEQVERALDGFRAAGAELVEADLPDLTLLPPFACAYPILIEEARAAMERFIAAEHLEVTLDDVIAQLTPDVHALFTDLVDKQPPPFDLAKSLADRDTLIAMYAHHMDTHRLDLLAMPTTPFTAPAIGATTVRYAHADANWFDVIESNTAVGAVVAHPGVSLPVGLSDGLPVGLLLEGRTGDDRHLLAAARALA